MNYFNCWPIRFGVHRIGFFGACYYRPGEHVFTDSLFCAYDHRGRAYDNIFVERLWRTIKYEEVYVKAYETPREARIGINSYMRYYNHERPHSRLGYRTPEEIYWGR